MAIDKETRERIGKLIRDKRKSLGMNQEQLALAVGYPRQQIIANIENGHADIPRHKIGDFARVLNLSFSETLSLYRDIWGRDLTLHEEKIFFPDEEKSVPLIEEIPKYLDIKDFTYKKKTNQVFYIPLRKQDCIAIQINDNSLAPKFMANEVIVITTGQNIEDGDYAVVRFKDGRNVIARIKYLEGDMILLERKSDTEVVKKENVDIMYKIILTKHR